MNESPDFWITESLTARKEEALSQAFLSGGRGIALSPLTNIAAGYGEAVIALECDGMLRRERGQNPTFSLFSLTEKGRLAHAMLKPDDPED